MGRCPIFPPPSEKRASLFKIFFKKSRSWMDALYARSYNMMMGEIQLPTSKLFMVNDLQEVKKIMIEKPNEFPKHDVLHEVLEPLLGNSIFTTNGEEWQRQRDLLVPGFKQNNVESVFARMTQATDAMMLRLAKEPLDGGETFDIEPEMTLVTADIIFRAIMSTNIDEKEAKEVLTAFAGYQQKSPLITLLRMFGIPNNFLLRRFDRKRVAEGKVIRRAIERVIEERSEAFKKGEKEDDILNSVLETAEKSDKAFSIKEIADQIVMLFLAGHETSAAGLTWTLYLISLYPEEQEKLFAEITAVNATEPFGFRDVKAFPYLKQVFMESLRLYPPVGFFARQSSHETEMRGKKIKPKDAIIIAPWLIQRNENNWEKPHEFCPHRFDNGDPSERGAYLPFGMGQRVCIGMSFAIQEAMLILATLIREYRFELEAGFEPQPVGKITIRSENGLRVKMIKRNPS
ncbi:MAG: cytochrome P450 [Thiotrichales bacterium]|nr:cytochrome P450 [Thiotrichales bacterium]